MFDSRPDTPTPNTLGLVDLDDACLVLDIQDAFRLTFGPEELLKWHTMGDIHTSLLDHLSTTDPRPVLGEGEIWEKLAAIASGLTTVPACEIRPETVLLKREYRGMRKRPNSLLDRVRRILRRFV